MSDKELETLAIQLWLQHEKVLGQDTFEILFDNLDKIEQDAWMAVAQFVGSRDNDMRNHLTEVINNREWPDHR